MPTGPRCDAFLFHGIFADADELAHGDALPQQSVTLDWFDRFLAGLAASGRRFVSIDDLVNGLDRGHHALISFDDGYANTLRALPALERHGAPATIYVTTGPVESGGCFWWDVLFREGRRRGWSPEDGDRRRSELKKLAAGAAADTLRDEFGPAAFEPRGDADRPLTPAEIGSLAEHPLVTIGNHTVDHARLDRGDESERAHQVDRAQDRLEQWTGARPDTLAYPFGSHDRAILRLLRDRGFRSALTTQPVRNRGGRWPSPPLRLGRFTPDARQPIEPQLRRFLA